MEILTQNFLWMRNLGSTPSLEAENRQRYPERVKTVSEKLKIVDVQAKSTSGSGGSTGANLGKNVNAQNNQVSKACEGVVELATEKIHESIVQAAKKEIFS